jgi:hypothetical protein
MDLGADPDDDGNPDVWELFRHYDKLYFRGVLVDAGFSVEWSHPRMKTIRYAGLIGFFLLLLVPRWFSRSPAVSLIFGGTPHPGVVGIPSRRRLAREFF